MDNQAPKKKHLMKSGISGVVNPNKTLVTIKPAINKNVLKPRQNAVFPIRRHALCYRQRDNEQLHRDVSLVRKNHIRKTEQNFVLKNGSDYPAPIRARAR
jgi:hypothetical protein